MEGIFCFCPLSTKKKGSGSYIQVASSYCTFLLLIEEMDLSSKVSVISVEFQSSTVPLLIIFSEKIRRELFPPDHFLYRKKRSLTKKNLKLFFRLRRYKWGNLGGEQVTGILLICLFLISFLSMI